MSWALFILGCIFFWAIGFFVGFQCKNNPQACKPASVSKFY